MSTQAQYATSFEGDTVVSKSYIRSLKHKVYLIRAAAFNCQLEQSQLLHSFRIDSLINTEAHELVVKTLSRQLLPIRVQTFKMDKKHVQKLQLRDQYYTLKGNLVYEESWLCNPAGTPTKLTSRQRFLLDEQERQVTFIFERWDENGHWARKVMKYYDEKGAELPPRMYPIDPDEFWD
ncbi:hypothetical protein [Chitinophaga skermanii]|uniref:hypothetical protein n=1 Tax=Chitinophaga skermanii TaxID=331697 RepID=UPI0011E5C205|nr:hypothetical protein [Chitinophaga skermanii]